MTSIEEKLDDCIEAASASNSPFNDWEKEFIASIDEQFKERGSLSPRQEEILHKIWDKI